MSFTLNPVFSFRLNQTIVGEIKFGKFDGIHVCLTAATSTDKVLIHSPHKKIGSTNNRIAWSETNYDIALLNFNQEITAIETGRIAHDDPKEILVIGSPTHVLAYNVDDNTDLFYNEIREGVSEILVGPCGAHLTPLVILGGNDSVRGFDQFGKEAFWIVANGHVKSLSLIDVNKDGKNELIVGTQTGHILVYKDEIILMDLSENSAVTSICQIEKSHLLAYTLADGTLGVYDDSIRMWRIKSKNKGTSLASYDLLGTGKNQLVVGWDSGKVDMRDYNTGDVLFKLQFQQAVLALGLADYRGNGTIDLVMCTVNGEVRGYEKSKINLFSMKPVEHEELAALLSVKKQLLAELSHYEANVKINKDRLAATMDGEISQSRMLPSTGEVGIIPANTRLHVAIETNIEDINRANIEIKVGTNNSTVIRAVLLFSEGIFASETYIAYPAERGVPRVVIPFVIPKDICYDINIKALLGNEHSQQFHVFELTRQLPKFAMYAVLENYMFRQSLPSDFKVSENRVSFETTERFQRIFLWINQNFLLTSDNEIDSEDDIRDFRMCMISLHDKSHVMFEYSGGKEISLHTDNIELAGNFVQSMAHFFNLEHLQTKANFPRIEHEVAELFRKIDGYQTTYTNLSLDMAHKKNQQKNLIVRVEDSRLYNQESLPGIFADMQTLTEDLVSVHTIRQKTFAEIQRSLEGINAILKSASKLRVGQHATNMMKFLKEAVKAKNISSINKIISTGIN